MEGNGSEAVSGDLVVGNKKYYSQLKKLAAKKYSKKGHWHWEKFSYLGVEFSSISLYIFSANMNVSLAQVITWLKDKQCYDENRYYKNSGVKL